MSIQRTYQEVLDAIECDAEGEERCLLLTHAVRQAMLAVLEEVAEILDDGLDDEPSKPVITYLLSGVRDEIAALTPPDSQEPPEQEDA